MVLFFLLLGFGPYSESFSLQLVCKLDNSPNNQFVQLFCQVDFIQIRKFFLILPEILLTASEVKPHDCHFSVLVSFDDGGSTLSGLSRYSVDYVPRIDIGIKNVPFPSQSILLQPDRLTPFLFVLGNRVSEDR